MSELVVRPFQGSGTGRETLPEASNWSGDPPRGQEVFGRSSRGSGTGRETLPEVQNWSGDPPGFLELVG